MLGSLYYAYMFSKRRSVVIFNKNQITHIGEYDSGSKVYMRKNKCGQWNVLILDRKGYRWDMLNYVNYPKTIYGVTQCELEYHLFEATRVFKQEKLCLQ